MAILISLNILFKKHITMKKLIFSFIVVATAILSSCNNDDIPTVQNEGDKTRAIETVDYLNITYKGIKYKNVPTTYDENGDFIFLDNEFSAVYQNELANDYDWSISAKDSYNITFYPSLESNLKSNGLTVIEDANSSTKSILKQLTRSASDSLAVLTLYDDKYYKDRSLTFGLFENKHNYPVANLKDKKYKFNDKCSSLIIKNNFPDDPDHYFPLNVGNCPYSKVEAVFVGYDDRNFSDRTITGIAVANSIKKYATLPGFNDKLSSFKFLLARKGQYHDDINS